MDIETTQLTPIPSSIKEIEAQLQAIMIKDRQDWVSTYLLMEKVDRESLYTENYSTYTQWVKTMAAACGVHESVLWKRKKAGAYYAAYEARASAAGRTVTPIEQIAISPDNLELIEKIAGSNTDVADDLINQTSAGTLGRNKLKNAWTTVKSRRIEKGERPSPRSHHYTPVSPALPTEPVTPDQQTNSQIPSTETLQDPDTQPYQTLNSTEPAVTAPVPTMTAMDIILALQNNTTWLPDQIESKYSAYKYRLFSEFAVQTGGATRNARRIDALIAESFSVRTQYEITLHAIEIKVDRNDLLHDDKMQEYTDFADLFWLAVPAELETDAKSILLDGWGLLIIHDHSIQVSVQATKHPGIMRDITLAEALQKLL